MISSPVRCSSNVAMRRTSTPSIAGGSRSIASDVNVGSSGGSGSRQPSSRSAATTSAGGSASTHANPAPGSSGWTSRTRDGPSSAFTWRRQTVPHRLSADTDTKNRTLSTSRAPGSGRYAPGASAKSLVAELVGNRQRVVESLDPVLELLARDRERRAHHDDVPVRHQVDAALERALHQRRDRLDRLARRVERHERLARLAVLDELEAPEAAESAHVADRRVPLREPPQLGAEDLAHRRRVLDDALLLERLDRGDAGGARQRMATVGEPAGEVAPADPVGNRLAHDHRAERDVARV